MQTYITAAQALKELHQRMFVKEEVQIAILHQLEEMNQRLRVISKRLDKQEDE